MNKKLSLFILFFIIASVFNLIAERLFYLSTDRTFSAEERKRIKVESGYYLNSLKIRIYKINDVEKFYKSQSDFHRPKIEGRRFRYFTPDVLEGFTGYLRNGLREWARENIPSENRKSIMESYPDFALKEKEEYYSPEKIIKIIDDDNFTLVNEINYLLDENEGDWNYNYIFLDDLNEGSYLVEGISTENVAYTVLNVSNYGFIVKKANDNMLFYTVNNLSGEPAGDIELTIFNRFKKELKSAKSDKDGLVKLKLSENDLFIIGKSQDNICTFFDPKYFPSNVRDDYVYIYTERPVYKGGDEVFIKVIYRGYKDDKYFVKEAKGIKLELVDARGKMIESLGPSATDSNGCFSTSVKLPDDAAAGRYLIIANINNKKFEGEFKVEYYKKPEYQVMVKPDKDIYVSGEKITASVFANYYFGEPVKEAEVRYSVYRTRFSDSQWESEKDKDFYLSEEEFVYSQMEQVDSGSTKFDKSGIAKITINTIKDDNPYYYSIQAVVTDKAGVPISGGSRVMVTPSNFRIGIKCDKFVYVLNEKVTVSISTTDYSNNPISENISVNISSEILPGKTHVFLDKKISTDSNGNAEVTFKAEKNGFVKIEIEGFDKNKNRAVTEKYIWIGKEGAVFNYKGGMVKLVLDKPYYEIGDTAKLLVLTPVPGIKYLLTVEGDSIYSESVSQFASNSTIVDIPIKRNYLPNVFVDISFIFDNKFYNNTIKITVPPKEQFINIDLKPDKNKYTPRSSGNVSVKVTDNKNNPVGNADISIAVVDEAIYGISQEIAVDIHKYFYPYRRNNIMTWTSIGYRFYGYSMNAKSELAKKYMKDPNGLASFKDEEDRERKEFKDTILWIPSLRTDKEGLANFKINFPDNITKWRITAVGVTNDTKVGKSVQHVITKLDFFAEISLPAYLNENDKASVYGIVHNYSDETLKTKVELTGKNIKIEGDKKELSLAPNSNEVVEWVINPGVIGNAEFTLKADAGKYTDTIKKSIYIIPHSIMKTINVNKEITVKSRSFDFKKPKNIKDNNQKIRVNVSYGYISVILDALPYLINYPYGCVEQTTSSFLPNLVAVNAFNNIKIKLPDIEKKLPENISKGLSILYGYQQENGSWGWFNEGGIDIFMTSYVLYALTLSKKLGLTVSNDALQKGLNALEKNISLSRNNTETIYALYVMSLNNKKYASIFQGMVRSAKDLGDYDLALLTLTAVNYNMEKDAKSFIEILKNRAKKYDNDMLYWGDDYTRNWNKDSVETTAWVIKALNFFEPNSKTVHKALRWLISKKEGNRWKSTRDTSAVVMAICDMFKYTKINEGDFVIKLNNNQIGSIKFSRDYFNSVIEIPQDNFIQYLKDDNTVKIEGDFGKNDILFLSFSYEYYTNEKTIEALSAGITVRRNYYALNEYRGYDDKIKYKLGGRVSSINKGENFIVEISISLAKESDYIMIEDYMPAGCIAVKDFLLYNIDGINRGKPDFIDFRNDRVIFFLNRASDIKLYYVVNPVYKGDYKVMPAVASLMYFPVFRGNSDDNSITIK